MSVSSFCSQLIGRQRKRRLCVLWVEASSSWLGWMLNIYNVIIRVLCCIWSFPVPTWQRPAAQSVAPWRAFITLSSSSSPDHPRPGVRVRDLRAAGKCVRAFFKMWSSSVQTLSPCLLWIMRSGGALHTTPAARPPVNNEGREKGTFRGRGYISGEQGLPRFTLRVVQTVTHVRAVSIVWLFNTAPRRADRKELHSEQRSSSLIISVWKGPVLPEDISRVSERPVLNSHSNWDQWGY